MAARVSAMMRAVILRSSARAVRRVVVTLLGGAVLALGIVLLALPGPGVLVIALGFLILSSEYEWARRRFETARKTAADLADQAVAKPWSTVLSILGSLALIAAGFVWGAVSALPFSSWWTGGSLIFGGLAALTTILVSVRQAKATRKTAETTAEKAA
jgi:Putative transmembrane protein (PGPGW)